jgi:hypothetical protein
MQRLGLVLLRVFTEGPAVAPSNRVDLGCTTGCPVADSDALVAVFVSWFNVDTRSLAVNVRMVSALR